MASHEDHNVAENLAIESAHGVRSCWIVLLPLGNIYVYSAADVYQIFRVYETLHDTVLDMSIPLAEVFETD